MLDDESTTFLFQSESIEKQEFVFAYTMRWYYRNWIKYLRVDSLKSVARGKISRT